MVDNIIKLEQAAMRAALDDPDLSALISFDIKEAFPSLAHDFIWWVLLVAGVPLHIIRMFRLLYTYGHSDLIFNGRTIARFKFLCGAKQGGPSSADLFITSIDCLIRLLICKLGPAASVTGFMDDIGALIRNALKDLRKAAGVFVIAEHAAGLVLNIAKTKFCPIYTQNKHRIIYTLHNGASFFRDAKIVDSFEYLGKYVGRSDVLQSFEKGLGRFSSAVEFLRSLTCGTATMMSLFKMVATPTLLWAASLQKVPKQVLHI